MSSCFNRAGYPARGARFSVTLLSFCALGVAWSAGTQVGSFSLAVHAMQSRTAAEGVYRDDQAQRGQAIYKNQCSMCHGETLGGDLAPPLAGGDFIGVWGEQPLSDLVGKIQSTMPASDPGKLTRQQAADIVAYILQVGKFPAGQAELSADEAALKQITLPRAQAPSSRQQATLPAAHALSSRPFANLGQVMRGILFPSSNIIFDVQTRDPGAQQKTGLDFAGATAAFQGVYQGWQLVDLAAAALVESAPLLMTPGRRCENGKPVPVERADWVKYTEEMAEAGRAAYKASQSRNRDSVIEVTNQIADSCLNCHIVYRDKPGGNATDPTNKAARCVP